MKFSTQLLLAASAFCVMACSQENNNTNTEAASADDFSANTTMPAATSQTTTTPPDTANPGITVTATPPTDQPVAAGMNPPHGQPGHRCDIEVGAPLNSAPNPAPATAPKPNITTSATQQPAAPKLNTSPVFNAAPANQPVAAGMNPPHGQPGHDCGIPVGAPLKK